MVASATKLYAPDPPMTPTREQSVGKIVVDWVSAADGSCNVALDKKLNGFIRRVLANPAGGADAPTDNYDITLEDQEGFDVLGGLLANRDTATTELVDVAATFAGGIAVSGTHTLKIAAAGDTKKGRIIIYYSLQ